IPAALDALAVGGRLVALSYHSLEDRIVKRALAVLSTSRTPAGLPVELPGHGPQLCGLTRGAERAGPAEISANPRAASVRLPAAPARPAPPRRGRPSCPPPLARRPPPRVGLRRPPAGRMPCTPETGTPGPRVAALGLSPEPMLAERSG